MKVRIEFDTEGGIAATNSLKVFHDDVRQDSLLHVAIVANGDNELMDYQIERHLKDADGKIIWDKNEFVNVAMGPFQEKRIYEDLFQKLVKYRDTGSTLLLNERERILCQVLFPDAVEYKANKDEVSEV